jgi:hypothetical protein
MQHLPGPTAHLAAAAVSCPVPMSSRASGGGNFTAPPAPEPCRVPMPTEDPEPGRLFFPPSFFPAFLSPPAPPLSPPFRPSSDDPPVHSHIPRWHSHCAVVPSSSM